LRLSAREGARDCTRSVTRMRCERNGWRGFGGGGIGDPFDRMGRMGRIDRMNLSDSGVVRVNVEVAAFTRGQQSCLYPVHPPHPFHLVKENSSVLTRLKKAMSSKRGSSK
jgi:hypothetical protein